MIAVSFIGVSQSPGFKKKKSGSGCLFWFALIALVFYLFIEKDKDKQTDKINNSSSTGFTQKSEGVGSNNKFKDEIKRIQKLSSSEQEEELFYILELGEVSDKLTDQLYKYSVIYQNICDKTDLKRKLYSLD